MLDKPIPRTRDHFFYHCLYYQQVSQFDSVDQLLNRWIKTHGYLARVREIQNRQALLNYSKNPNKTLVYLKQQLRLRFDHQKDRLDSRIDLPSQLHSNLISWSTLAKQSMQRYKNLMGFEDPALDWLATSKLNPIQRRDLLSRLKRPDYPNMAKLVVQDLNYKGSTGFGAFSVHRHLLLDQLHECLRLKPAIINDTTFVHTYLTKLQPSPDANWRSTPKEHRDYLDLLWNFVKQLEPNQNSLKAHVLYHRLKFDRQRGEYDKQRFMTYLQLPRSASYVNPRYLRSPAAAHFPVDLTLDASEVTILPAVRDDEHLVRSYLEHFLLRKRLPNLMNHTFATSTSRHYMPKHKSSTV